MQNYKKQKLLPGRLEFEDLIYKKKWEEAYCKLKEILDYKKSQALEITSNDFCELCELCNYIAMISLKQSNYELVVQYLQRAQKYCKYSSYLTLVTLNNWGCYFKKINNNSLALLYMTKAITIAKTIKSKVLDQRNYEKIRFLADCYLNLCAILSNMNQHQLALENVTIAVHYIENELIQFEKSYEGEIEKINDRHNVLIIAKFNLAVQLEYLKRYFQSLKAYKNLRQYILINFNLNHNLLKIVDKAIQQLEIKLIKKRKSSLKFEFTDKQSQEKKSYLPSLSILKQTNQNCRKSSLSNHKDKQLNSTQKRKKSIHKRIIPSTSRFNNPNQIENYFE